MIELAIEALGTCRDVLLFTGAGISTDSGIPDFRGPNGVWKTLDPADFTLERYVADPEIRRRSWSIRSASGVLEAMPNDGHFAITALWEAGRLAACVTQNIDGLHQRAGLPDETVIELHGNVHTTRCLRCARRWPTGAVLARVTSGDGDPHCEECGGILKVDVILFGESMPEGVMERAISATLRADAVIAVGSTLSVYPAAYVPLTAVEQGIPVIIINQGPTDLDRLATVKVAAPAGGTLRHLAEVTSHS